MPWAAAPDHFEKRRADHEREQRRTISIKGTQSYEQQEDDVIELVTEGRLEREDEGHFTLSYQESEVTGLEGTLTTFQIEPERITLMRLGGVNSEMVFELGRRHLSMYDTRTARWPWGSTPGSSLPPWTSRGAQSASSMTSSWTTPWPGAIPLISRSQPAGEAGRWGLTVDALNLIQMRGNKLCPI